MLSLTHLLRPSREHTEIEEELHTSAHIDYDRVAIVANPSVSALYEDALVYENGTAITSTGAMTAYSGAKTGRSPLDKRIVKEGTSDKDVWWGPVNKAMSPEVCYHLVLFTSPTTPKPSTTRGTTAQDRRHVDKSRNNLLSSPQPGKLGYENADAL